MTVTTGDTEAPGWADQPRVLPADVVVPAPPPPRPGIEVVVEPCVVRSDERRRQRLARGLVVVGLAGAAGLTVGALVTVPSSGSSAVDPGAGQTLTPVRGDEVGTAGLAPSIDPLPTVAPPGAATP